MFNLQRTTDFCQARQLDCKNPLGILGMETRFEQLLLELGQD